MPPRLQTPFIRTTPETASANIADTNASETTPAPEMASANIADANENETTPGLQAIMVHGTTAKDEGEVATSKGGGGKLRESPLTETEIIPRRRSFVE
jgi:hypothetical protein